MQRGYKKRKNYTFLRVILSIFAIFVVLSLIGVYVVYKYSPNNYNIESNKILGEKDCDNLIKNKSDALAYYVSYYGSMLSGTQNIVMNNKDLSQSVKEETYKTVLNNLWNQQLSFSEKYLGTMVGVASGYNPMGKGSLDAPDFCSNKQAQRVKKYDNMYIEFYNCIINNDKNKDYVYINLMECSSDLSNVYLDDVMNIYYSDKT